MTALVLLLVPIVMTINGLVLSKFWNWFVVPTFVGTPTLSVTQAIGLAFVVSVLVPRSPSNYKTAWGDLTFDERILAVVVMLVAPWVLLGAGAVLKFLVGVP